MFKSQSAQRGSMQRAMGAGKYSPLKHEVLGKKAAESVQPCIYQVPAHVKKMHREAYKPEVVSLGPFHHGEPDLLPMEEHKKRALDHLLRRAGKGLEDLMADMRKVAQQLENAYQDLDDNWHGEQNRDRFLKVLVTDGCFVLELMRVATRGRREIQEYAPKDPVFSRHGILYMVPYIRSDMLMIENQLPLLLLQKLVEFETGKSTREESIKILVLRFLSPRSKVPTSAGPGLHALNIFRKSLLSSPGQYLELDLQDGQDVNGANGVTVHSAVELDNAGIRFRMSKTESLRDISFRSGWLSLPRIVIRDSTESMFLNLMAFERMHVGAGNDVTAYVFFMDSILNSAEDVALLRSKNIIHKAVGSDEAVVRLFGSISRKVVLDPDSTLDSVHRQLNFYCHNHVRTTLYSWWANLVSRYLWKPWTFVSFTAATLVLGFGVTQTVYAILPYYHSKI